MKTYVSKVLAVAIGLFLCVVLYILSLESLHKYNNVNVSELEQRDTITNISYWNTKSLDGVDRKIATYERIYRYGKDTIFHVKEDYLNESSNPDYLFNELDSIYGSKLYVDGSGQRTTYARFYSTITTIFEEYATVHINEYFKEKEQGLHGDGMDYYYTYKVDDDSWLVESIFIDPNNINLKSLVADAIIEYRKNHWWTERELETVDIVQLKERYMELNIPFSWKAAIAEDGVIFSFDYNELGLCFAEYCVHALVPYSKLKGLLAPPFDSLVE